MIDLVIVSGVILGGLLLGPGSEFVIAAKVVSLKMDLDEARSISGDDLSMVVSDANGDFKIVGVGLLSEDKQIAVGYEIWLETEDQGFFLTSAEAAFLKRTEFIDQCMIGGVPLGNHHYSALSKIAKDRAEEIKATPRRRASRA